jgi:hypothetical protein
LGVPIALEKEAVVAPVVAARYWEIDRRLAIQKAALGLIVEHLPDPRPKADESATASNGGRSHNPPKDHQIPPEF